MNNIESDYKTKNSHSTLTTLILLIGTIIMLCGCASISTLLSGDFDTWVTEFQKAIDGSDI